MAADTLNWKRLLRRLRHLTASQILLLTGLVTLVPIALGLFLWQQMPEQIALFVDSDLRPDGQISLPMAIFPVPLVLLVAQLILFFLVRNRAEEQEKRLSVFQITLWILPILSNLLSYMTYALAMGSRYSIASYVQLLLGLLFAVIGSYLPKIKPNSAIGFRIPWAFTSRHNWRATHRISGYGWMIGGLLMILSAFIPGQFVEEITLGILLALMLLPAGFSYGYYLRQKAKGDPLHHVPRPGKGMTLFLAALVVLAAVLSFTGGLDYRFQEEQLLIKASYYDDFVVRYSDIEAVDYYGGDVEGDRIGGFSNLRLQMGFYHDPEREDTYTRYTYFHPDACVILTLRDRQLVLSGKNQAETQKLYEQLLAKTEQ